MIILTPYDLLITDTGNAPRGGYEEKIQTDDTIIILNLPTTGDFGNISQPFDVRRISYISSKFSSNHGNYCKRIQESTVCENQYYTKLLRSKHIGLRNVNLDL